jgi:hypothetical protein
VATLLCALAIYPLERHAHDSAFTSYGQALFWSSSQLLTLGSSLEPVTVPGRILAVAMDVYAVVVIGRSLRAIPRDSDGLHADRIYALVVTTAT